MYHPRVHVDSHRRFVLPPPPQHHCDSLELAVDQVREGKAWAAIEIGQNFSQDLVNRVLEPLQSKMPSPTTINGSTIHLYMDVTSTCGNVARAPRPSVLLRNYYYSQIW